MVEENGEKLFTIDERIEARKHKSLESVPITQVNACFIRDIVQGYLFNGGGGVSEHAFEKRNGYELFVYLASLSDDERCKVSTCRHGFYRGGKGKYCQSRNISDVPEVALREETDRVFIADRVIVSFRNPGLVFNMNTPMALLNEAFPTQKGTNVSDLITPDPEKLENMQDYGIIAVGLMLLRHSF